MQIQQLDGSWVLYILYRPPELVDEWRRMEQARANESFKKQAYADATQWAELRGDSGVAGSTTSGSLMFISNRTGEIRTGAPDAEKWVVHDDGHGFPCFFNTETEETVHDDPRFLEDTNADIAAQKAFVLQEMRIAVYFCSDYWERYSKAPNEKRAMAVAMQARNSSKPKHLVAFLIRAKALFKQVSVVDIPIDQKIQKELEYASWLAEQIATIVQLAETRVVAQRDAQVKHTEKLLAKSKGKVYCTNCKRETKRNYEFCKICGKRQIFLLDRLEDDVHQLEGSRQQQQIDERPAENEQDNISELLDGNSDI